MSDVHRWNTAVAKITEDDILIRGVDMRELIRGRRFTEVAFLAVRGRFPTDAETRMLDGALVALVDHGLVSSHVAAARYIVSGHPNVVAGIAGGILAAGPNTLSPESAAEFIEEAITLRAAMHATIEAAAAAIVDDVIARRRLIPGIGHVVHKVSDPRTVELRTLAAELGFIGERVALYEAIHAEFQRRKGRELPINADGMLAAILGEMGWAPCAMAGLAVFAALPGILAHVLEEMSSGAPHRFIPENQVTYVGEG